MTHKGKAGTDLLFEAAITALPNSGVEIIVRVRVSCVYEAEAGL